MKGKKNKNGATSVIKVVAKVEKDEQIIKETQTKKKFLEEKLIQTISEANEYQARLKEVQQRYIDIVHVREREEDKFQAVEADFSNQKKLIDINFNEKINLLKEQERSKKEKIQNLNDEIDTIKRDHESKKKQKEKMLSMIKSNIDELSKFFSAQLVNIQKDLQVQIEDIAKNWELNMTDYLKKYEEEMKKFDVHNK